MDRVTEVHVSAMVNGVDPDHMSNLSPFHQMLSTPGPQDALDARLQAFNTSVCRNCPFRKLRSFNLLQVDPKTSVIPVSNTFPAGDQVGRVFFVG